MINTPSTLISIIIPCYNSEKHIKECINSVLNQSFQNYEIIIVNDGSTDGTGDIILSYKDKRIKLITQKNSGVSSARNNGIKHANGQWIAFLDSDDIWYPEKLEQQIKYCNKFDFICSNCNFITDKLTSKLSFSEISKPCTDKKEIIPTLIQRNFIPSSSVMIKKSILLDVGIFDTNFNGPEDIDLWLRILDKGYAFTYIAIPLFGYRLRSNSLSDNLIEITRSLTDVLKKFSKNTKTKRYKKLANQSVKQRKILINNWSFNKEAPYKERFTDLLKAIAMMSSIQSIINKIIYVISPELLYRINPYLFYTKSNVRFLRTKVLNEDLEKPLVSIIIPAYNYRRYIKESIESALNQTYSNIEIIVIDDGSTDKTSEIVKDYRDRIQYYYKKNSGLSDSRNVGISLASGMYITFLDADDKFDPQFVKKTLQAICTNTKVDYIYTQMKFFGKESIITSYPNFNLKLLLENNYINASCLIKRSIFNKFHYDITFKTAWEDYDFYLMLAEAGYKGKRVNEPLVFYRKHGNSQIDSLNGKKYGKLRRKIILKHWRLYGIKYIISFYLKSALLRVSNFKSIELNKK